ncbi:MAG: sigma-54-dependent Fis family transcriptional regulator, partial [Acidobacteria bacterium]|nr:sigma-54-dependent Fis family transcriptional regulator [Acidobacteriota bacterium]
MSRKKPGGVWDVAERGDEGPSFPTLVHHPFDQMVGTSPTICAVVKWARAASHATTPVLILGETGTGKELLARAIHANGPRGARPFVPVNCAALPHDLIESELFGHRRGAFSGALADHPGLFASAQRGTLLLDEIGELSEGAQAKLLRVLQSGELRPVGGVENRNVDVRVIAATNRSRRELRAGVLREDLFYRLSVVVIEIPPLRERLDDIPPLFEHFLARHRGHGAARLSQVEPEALDLLLCYPFPGNVRELENLAQFLCTMLPAHQETVGAQDVSGWLRRQCAGAISDAPGHGSLNLSGLEAWAIRTAIERAGGNKSRAATMLGISRDTRHRKLRELEAQRLTSETVQVCGRVT